MTNQATISVKGVGHVGQAPDRTVITFSMSSLHLEYETAVGDLNERVAALRDRLGGVGIDKSDVKTTSFDIDAHHEYQRKKEESIFVGWKARHNLRLELPIDRDQINRVFGAIASTEVESDIGVRFEVSDREGLREKVLADATRAARRNAEAIASAAGCRLGKVQRVDYDWSEIRFGSLDYSLESGPELNRLMSGPDIEPEDVSAEDSVTIVWELVEG